MGKPRPALVVMDDALITTSTRLVIVPFTSTIQDAPLVRVTILPSTANGLKVTSQAMVDRITSLPREKVGRAIGQLEADAVDRVLGLVLLMIGAK